MTRIIHLNWKELFSFRYGRQELERPTEFFHAHEGMEFLYIHEGSGQIILNGQVYLIKPPMLIYYQPFQPHFLHMSFPYTRSILKIKQPIQERFLHLFPSLGQFMTMLIQSKAIQQVFPLTDKQDEELHTQFRMFHETLSITSLCDRAESFFCFLPMFLTYVKTRLFVDQPSFPQTIQLRDSLHIEKAMQWIELNFKREIQLEALASEIHLSPSYVSRMFRKYTGSTLMEFIGKRRLQEASLLLRTSSLSVSQVAQHSGYPDVAYFCRSFKKKYGTTPLQYRASSQSLHSAMEKLNPY